jgi:flagellar hook-associated protein 3 FlgL
MRLSTNQMFNQGVDSILESQQRLTKAQDRIVNQTRLLTPSDDPAATAQVMRLNERIELTKQYDVNGSILTNHLNTEEVAITSIKIAMDRLKVLTIQAGSGSLADADRVGLGFEVDSIRKGVLDTMNTRNANGDHIFSGFQSSVEPFVFNATTQKYDYMGDEGELKIQISPSVKLSAGDNGKKLFEDVDARLRATNVGVTAGAGTGGIVTIESQAVYDTFHQANYDTITPANNVYDVTYGTLPDTYSITNSGTGAVLVAATPYSPTQGASFQGMNIKGQGTGAGSVVSFTLSTPEKSNILTTINDLYKALNVGGGFTPALNESLKDAMVQITNSANQIAVVQASLGGRLNVVDSILSSNLEINHANQKTRSDLAEIDYSVAVTDLMKQESALEAAQATFGRVSRLSLFDFIR